MYVYVCDWVQDNPAYKLDLLHTLDKSACTTSSQGCFLLNGGKQGVEMYYLFDNSNGCKRYIANRETQNLQWKSKPETYDYVFTTNFTEAMFFSVNGIISKQRYYQGLLGMQLMPEIFNYSDYLKTSHWQECKKIVSERANHKCEICGKQDNDGVFHVHHLSYENLFHELTHSCCGKYGDLIYLCANCHTIIHDTLNLIKSNAEEFNSNTRSILYPIIKEHFDKEWESFITEVCEIIADYQGYKKSPRFPEIYKYLWDGARDDFSISTRGSVLDCTKKISELRKSKGYKEK